MSTYRARQRWEIRARRPVADVIAYFEDSLAKAIEARIDGVEVERRSLGTGRSVVVRADGFVIMFAIAPVRGGHPFRRSLRRRGVVDLTGTVIVSDEAADIMVLADDRPGRVQRAVRSLQTASDTHLEVLAGVTIALWLISPWLCLPLFAAFLIWPGEDGENGEALALPPPETVAQVTAVQLWKALCDDVGQLVAATNFVPALLDRA